MEYEFFVGSYGKTGEEGIVKFRMDTDRKTLNKLYGYKEIENPSYLAFNREKTILYAVSEQTPVGAVHALEVCGSGLKPLSALSTEGADPCHVTLDESGRVLFVGNYTSGSLAVYQMDGQAVPERLSEVIRHQGNGVHPSRQSAAHIHYTKEQDGRVFVADLGMDRVFLYDLDVQKAELHDTGERIVLPAGAGPRHLEFNRDHPEILYVICELSSQIAVFSEEDRGYVLKQLIGTLPDDFAGESTAAAVKMQDHLLFAGNRGHDSIAVFRVLDDGTLERTQIVDSGGKTPRDFSIFGDYLAAANQDSGLITVFKIGWENGTLEDAGMSAETVAPACIRKYR